MQSWNRQWWNEECRSTLALLAAAPAMVVAVGWWLRATVVTPYHNGYHDPDYAYLFNGASVANLVAPDHTDHPGTPLQMLIAVTLRTFHPTASPEQLTFQLLDDPEWYLAVVSTVLLLVVGALAVWAGVSIYRTTRDVGAALVAQWVPLVFVPVLVSMPRVMPEPLLFGVALLFGAALVKYCWSSESRESMRDAGVFGMLCGLGVAVKLTFVPAVIVPLIVLERWREHARFMKFFAIAFFVATLPWVLQFPLFALYRGFFRWTVNLFTGSGIYGSGPKTVIDWSSFGTSLQQITLQHTVYMVVIAVAVVISGWAVTRYLRRREPWHRVTRALVALSLFHTATVLMYAKHFQSERYMLAGMALTGVTLVLAVRQVSVLWPHAVTLRNIAYAIVGVAMLPMIQTAAGQFDSLRRASLERRTQFESVEQIIAGKYPGCVQVHQDSGSRMFAIFFGLQWARLSVGMARARDEYFSGRQFFTYDPGAKKFLAVNEMEIDMQNVKTNGRCAILWGPSGVAPI